MISSTWIGIAVQGMLFFLATQPHIYTADFLIRTKTYSIRISIFLTPAFARQRGSGTEKKDFDGFIPELLAELKRRNATNEYDLHPVKEIGRKQANGNWTGLIEDVRSKTSNFGAGPILNTSEHHQAVVLSKAWATVQTTLVVRKASNITSLREALSKLGNFYVVENSDEAKELERASRQQGSYELITLQQRVKKIGSVYGGLTAVSREERSALVLNSEEARYYVTHDFCNLEMVGNFLPLGNYAFAYPPGSLEVDSMNYALLRMTQDGSLERLKEKTLGIPGVCNNAMFPYPGTAVAFLLAAVVSHFRL